MRIEEYNTLLNRSLNAEGNKRYCRFSQHGYALTARRSERVDLRELFSNAQAQLLEDLSNKEPFAWDPEKLSELIVNTERLKERYRRRAGNILVRLGFYTPKAKRETMRSAEGLIQKAEALKSLIHLSEQLQNPLFDSAVTSEEIKEQIRHIQGNDPLTLSTLLSLSEEDQPFEGIRELLDEEARDQFKNLVENAVSPREWERWVSSFSRGSWKRIKKTSDQFTYWENCHLLARAALMYLPSMHEEADYLRENREEINRLFRRGLRITYNC
jgi:hypothetical protein